MTQKMSIKNILFFFLTLLLFYLAYKIIDIVLIMFASYILACSFNPIVDKIETKMPRKFATAIILTLAFILVVTVLTPAIVVSFKELNLFLSSLPDKIFELTKFLDNIQVGNSTLSHYIDLNEITISAKTISSNLLEKITEFTFAMTQWVTVLLAVTIITFYLISDKVEIKSKFLTFFHQKNRKFANELADNISNKVGGYVIAQISVMFAVGVFTAIGLIILGVKNWFVLGLLAAIFDIIPVIGPIIAAFIGVFATANVSVIYSISIIAVYFIAQWLQNAWARPILYSKFLDLNPIIIILALLIASKFLGFWGVVLAPAFAAVICTLVNELYIKQINDDE